MSYHILIVEDEQAISRVIELKLKQAGYETTVASDGQQAISLLRSQTFDCILLDLILPKLDGFMVLSEIRAHNPGIKVLVMTNLGQPEDRQRVEEIGVNGYYVKSEMSIANLVDQVKLILQT